MKKINRLVVFGLISFALIFFTGCMTSTKKWQAQEKNEIQTYLSSIGDTVYDLKPSGLYYLDLIQGTGAMPVLNDTVFIWYRTTYLDGQLFMTNSEELLPYFFVVGYGPLQGLDEAVRYMKVGGKSKFLTPSSLAYGQNGLPPYLPGFTPLLWQVELVEVNQGSR